MSRKREDQERPCLHCLMVELIGDFFAEYPATGGSDKVDTDEADEVIDAIAKTVAELTSQQDGVIRQHVIEQLMRQIMHYDGEFAGRRRPPQSALTRSTKRGWGRPGKGANSTPPHLSRPLGSLSWLLAPHPLQVRAGYNQLQPLFVTMTDRELFHAGR